MIHTGRKDRTTMCDIGLLMALDLLSIPSMSSDCEMVFSQAKLMITGQRHRLKADIIEATQCLRAWYIMERKAIGSWKSSGKWEAPHELS